ncbi:MAG: DUF4301 family protein [Candidatus Aminicenantes bacterium]|nr:DUF4301 family protein [Candidatus Aminicenantes bacterium]
MKKEILTGKDLQQITAVGIGKEQILDQLAKFKKGAAPVHLTKPAVIGDGILRFSAKKEQELVSLFTTKAYARKIIKFVPASGAASRMFNALQNYRCAPAEEDKNNSEAVFIQDFIAAIEKKKFAFHEDLQAALKRGGFHIEDLLSRQDYHTIIKYLLDPRGLDYANLPKALLKFHHCEDGARTSLEEHLGEGIAYAKNAKNTVSLHLTISPEHRGKFADFTGEIISKYEKNGVTFEIEFSVQDPATDTVAVDEDNNLFRDRDNRLVLRPGGHGALIANLNRLDGDVIFIKNIDNVAPEHLQNETIKYKKILGGYLFEIQARVFAYLSALCEKETKDTPEEKLAEIARYAREILFVTFPEDFESRQAGRKKDFLVEKLNRPIRVCGMVENEGEPGGGPFWVKGPDGAVSLQIIEGAQIDKNSPAAAAILKKSSHFNPVDLICGIKDFRGKKFDLSKFVDTEAYFISEKSKDGRTLKAMELPGLWNGAMANWTTIFVEVPIGTFNPVKTVNDLLRPEHQTYHVERG